MGRHRGWAYLCCRVCLVRFGVLLDELLYDHIGMGAEFLFLFDVCVGFALEMPTNSGHSSRTTCTRNFGLKMHCTLQGALARGQFEICESCEDTYSIVPRSQGDLLFISHIMHHCSTAPAAPNNTLIPNNPVLRVIVGEVFSLAVFAWFFSASTLHEPVVLI